ncbi:MAG TPA: prepilin-type N-terminal cleavage/methylation domain-containing protein, partial [Syntrophales bacterium]|nr:prepilin-type N-terminal cleavage/methylation domain-containing protein [Syntrophales bacterium]
MIDQQTTGIFMGRKDNRVPPRTGRYSPAVKIPLRSRDDNRGFTLIEVVVAMALIMVLLAIAAPLMSAYLERSRGTTCLSMRYVTEKAEMTYMIEKGR